MRSGDYMEKKTEPEEKTEPELTIEQTFEELEGLLEMLEDSESSLEDSFRYYEKGMKLIKSGSAQIDRVEKQILVLSEDEDDAGF